MITRAALLLLIVHLGAAVSTSAQSNIDAMHKHAWHENVGWTNWRDANAAAEGVGIGESVLSGFIWGENVGWINVGDGTPGSTCGGLPCYGNADATDFGVNVDPEGELHGYAWAENVGWLNVDGGALASPPQPARIECGGRLTGYVWGENVGWFNLDDSIRYIALEAGAVPVTCDMNHDGAIDGLDIQVFLNLLFAPDGATWLDFCSGDVNGDAALTADDVADFVACLLGA